MEISTYEQTRQRAMSFINENQKVKLAELPNFSEKIKKSLLEDLRHRANYYERNDGLSRAKELIRAVQFLEEHENRE